MRLRGGRLRHRAVMRTALAAALLLSSCASTSRSAALSLEVTTPASPAPPLTENHFVRDRTGAISEAELREVLAAPVYLEGGARLGVVPVAQGFSPSEEVPQEAVPTSLAAALEASGLVELATEVSPDWPTDRGLPGLRELAARYRCDYLLLYRHRFREAHRPNGWAALYPTLLGALFLPGNSIEAAGVLEASLYDVRTGTLLFTAHERVRGERLASPPGTPRAAELLKRALLDEAGPRLAERVLSRFRRLSAQRPTARTPEGLSAIRAAPDR